MGLCGPGGPCRGFSKYLDHMHCVSGQKDPYPKNHSHSGDNETWYDDFSGHAWTTEAAGATLTKFISAIAQDWVLVQLGAPAPQISLS